MSIRASPLPSPTYANMQPMGGIQAIHGVPMMPFTTQNLAMTGTSTPNVAAFGANGHESFDRLKGMPSVGTAAPYFKAKAVIDGRIKDFELSQYVRQNEWVILVFIPMAWSFICPTEIRAFDRRIQEFDTRSCAVVFCSTDSEYVLRAWNHTAEEEGGLGGVHVPLISDRSHRIARDFGVLIEPEGVAQRAMFIIDPKGVIRQVTTNDANVGRSVDEARRLIDALEFTDEFGEGCPIDWKKGDRGLSMDSEGSSHKRNSSSAAPRQNSQSRASTSSQRPKHNRMNTWSGNLGWLAGRGSASGAGPGTPGGMTTPQPQNGGMSTPGERAGSMPVQNSWAMQQNAQHRLAPISDETEGPRTPGGRQMGSMGGYFDQIVSPLEQPQTVLNQMMHSAH